MLHGLGRTTTAATITYKESGEQWPWPWMRNVLARTLLTLCRTLVSTLTAHDLHCAPVAEWR